MRPSIARTGLIRDAQALSQMRNEMATEGEVKQEVAVHERGYAGFITMMKWGTIISLLTGLIVMFIIAD